MKSETREYRTGADEVVLDITATAPSSSPARATGCCSCSCRTRPPGIAVIETGAGSDDDLLAALGDLLPGRRPLAAPPRVAAATAART